MSKYLVLQNSTVTISYHFRTDRLMSASLARFLPTYQMLQRLAPRTLHRRYVHELAESQALLRRENTSKWKPYINADDNLTRLGKIPGVRFARNVPKRKNLLDVAERKVDVLMFTECTSKSQKGSEEQEGARTHDVRDQGPALWKVA